MVRPNFRRRLGESQDFMDSDVIHAAGGMQLLGMREDAPQIEVEISSDEDDEFLSPAEGRCKEHLEDQDDQKEVQQGEDQMATGTTTAVEPAEELGRASGEEGKQGSSEGGQLPALEDSEGEESECNDDDDDEEEEDMQVEVQDKEEEGDVQGEEEDEKEAPELVEPGPVFQGRREEIHTEGRLRECGRRPQEAPQDAEGQVHNEELLGNLSDKEVAIIHTMPVQMQKPETDFLLSHSPGTREMWKSLPHGIRMRAAASRRHAGLVRARVGEEEGVVQGEGVEEAGAELMEPALNDGSQEELPPTPPDLPTLEVSHRTYIPTHQYPPRSTRGEYSRVLATLWSRLAGNPESVTCWILHFIFQKVILPARRGMPQGDSCSQAKMVRDRLRRLRAGEYGKLWEEAVGLSKVPKKVGRGRKAVTEKTQEERNAERAVKLVQEGQYSRGLAALVSAGLAENSRATEEEMRRKHPQSQHPSTFKRTQPEVAQIVFSQKEVQDAVSSFRRGSAPGPSGVRPEHLKVAVKNSPPNRADQALGALTRLVNVMAAGKVPTEVAPDLCGARLHAAKKKDGGIRPIAVGNILRRLTAKLMASSLVGKAAELLSPHQLGVGVRGGCEAILHSVREVIGKGDPDQWVLQADLINAFNQADRDSAFREVEKHFPQILVWVLTSYQGESELLFCDKVIHSFTGFHQGDPLASLLFALVLQVLVRRIKEEIPELVMNSWFLDDGTQVGTLEQLGRVVDILKKEGPPLGLHLSTASTVKTPSLPKTTVWHPNIDQGPDDPLHQEVPRVKEAGIILLGAPVGSHQFTRKGLESRIEEVRGDHRSSPPQGPPQ